MTQTTTKRARLLGTCAVTAALWCSLPAPASADASVPNIISTPTVLGLTNSPYVLNGDVTVMPGATLVIQPGVQILVASSDATAGGVDPGRVELRIQGALIAQGTSSQPIEVRAQSSSSASAWYGIIVVPGAESATLDNVSIRNAVVGIENTRAGSLLRVSNTVIDTCISAIHSSDGAAVLDHLSISNIAQYGVHLDGKGGATLTHSSIINSGYPVWADITGGSASVDLNFVDVHSSPSGGVFVLSSGTGALSASIRNSTIHATSGVGVYAAGGSGTTTDVVIENSIVSQHAWGIYNAGGATINTTFSDVWSNGTNYVGAAPGPGCFSADPRYVAPPADLRLRPGSPCIGAGDAGQDVGAYGVGSVSFGMACSSTSECPAGHCVDGVCCDTAAASCGQCQACNLPGSPGTCAPVTGNACNDGRSDTANDVCTQGVCTGIDLCAGVTCDASDPCHVAGSCDPATGACTNPNAPDGTSCNDGNACTQTDRCSAGACVGSGAVICFAVDECHVGGACDPSSGVCSAPAAPDGSSCTDDGNVCTVDACAAGACVHPAGHAGMVCRPGLGVCDAQDTCDGVSTTCADAKQTTDTVCRAAADMCDAPETCDGATNDCPPDAKRDAGTVCGGSGYVCVAALCDGFSDACQISAADASPPQLSVVADQTFVGNCAGGAIAYTRPTVGDACDAAPVVSCPVLASDSFGDHLITCTARDARGNTNSSSFHVAVLVPVKVVVQPPLKEVGDNLVKLGSVVPHKVKLFDCRGQDVTSVVPAVAKLAVALKSGNCQSTNAVASHSGAGDAGGTMVKVSDGSSWFYQYSLSTKNFQVTASVPSFYESLVTVSYAAAPGVMAGQKAVTLETK